MNKFPVLLLGLYDTAIMTARCLVKNGIKVYGFDYEQRNNGFYSNIIKSYTITDPCKNEEKWLNELVSWLKNANDRFILIPTSDEFVLLAAKYKDLLCNYADFIIPDYDALHKIVNRDLQFKSAEGIGIPVPGFFKGPVTDINKINFDFPLALKPLNSIIWKQQFNNKGFLINNLEEFNKQTSIINNANVPYLVQEVIDGDNYNNYEVNSLLLPNGRIFQHTIRKQRQYPDGFGTATCIESYKNPEVEKLATDYIKKLNIIGFSNIEFKFDALKRQYFYIETNPRVWLQVNYSAKVGLNFPLLYYNYLLDNSLNSNTMNFRKGKWVNFLPDLLYFIKYRKKKKISMISFICSWFPLVSTSLPSITDPLPFLKDLNCRKRIRKLLN